jgi:mannitol-1-phosphate/altronate dehydrogenase
MGEFPAMVMYKLSVLNCAYAVAAYLGYREGCRYVHEAVAHPHVVPVLHGAVAEAKAALKAESPRQAEGIDRDAADALERIANARRAETVSRVVWGPHRKLSPCERLVGPARLASRHNLPHESLCTAIAAALTYNDPEDPQAVALQQAIAAEGVEKVLTEACGLSPHEALARTVKQQWLNLVDGGARGQVPTVGPFSQAGSLLEEIMHAVALELSQRYDSKRVRDVLAQVAQEFRETRVWSYVPILMKKQASDQLREMVR